MTTSLAPSDSFVPGHEVLALLASRGGRCPLAELQAEAIATFGADAVYGNCHGDRFGFEGLVAFLSSRGKLRVEAGVATLGHVAACGHA